VRRDCGGSYHLEVKRPRNLKPRRLVVDEELYRRRVEGATLRELAADYGVAHTTLSRYLRRRDATARLQEVRVSVREEERERRAELRRAAKKRREAAVDDVVIGEPSTTTADSGALNTGVVEVEAHPPPARLRTHVYPSDYANWLEERDDARPLTRRDSWTTNDETAARVVAEGGGIAQVMEATRHRDPQNLRRLIDPEILAAAERNDARVTD
jgi:hypothetical protein